MRNVRSVICSSFVFGGDVGDVGGGGGVPAPDGCAALPGASDDGIKDIMPSSLLPASLLSLRYINYCIVAIVILYKGNVGVATTHLGIGVIERRTEHMTEHRTVDNKQIIK